MEIFVLVFRFDKYVNGKIGLPEEFLDRLLRQIDSGHWRPGQAG